MEIRPDRPHPFASDAENATERTSLHPDALVRDWNACEAMHPDRTAYVTVVHRGYGIVVRIERCHSSDSGYWYRVVRIRGPRAPSHLSEGSLLILGIECTCQRQECTSDELLAELVSVLNEFGLAHVPRRAIVRNAKK